MKQELQVIMDLMQDLQEKMSYGEEDFAERLGRKKPEAELEIKVEGGELGNGHSEEPDLDDEMNAEVEEEGPEEKLKSRLMKLRA